MQRLISLRVSRDAQSSDNSAPDLYLSHVRDMCAALSKANTAEAASRKHSIKVLWRATGRASEPSALSYTTLKWNPHFDCAAVESPQSKPSKMKWVLFPAGACRHSDWMIDLGDLLCYQSRDVNGTPEMAFGEGEKACNSMALPRYRVPPSPSLTPTHLVRIVRGTGVHHFFFTVCPPLSTTHHPPPTTTHHPPPTAQIFTATTQAPKFPTSSRACSAAKMARSSTRTWPSLRCL